MYTFGRRWSENDVEVLLNKRQEGKFGWVKSGISRFAIDAFVFHFLE